MEYRGWDVSVDGLRFGKQKNLEESVFFFRRRDSNLVAEPLTN
jgi:hypothetical protein